MWQLGVFFKQCSYKNNIVELIINVFQFLEKLPSGKKKNKSVYLF